MAGVLQGLQYMVFVWGGCCELVGYGGYSKLGRRWDFMYGALLGYGEGSEL